MFVSGKYIACTPAARVRLPQCVTTDCAVIWDLKQPGGRVSGSDVVAEMVAMVALVAVVEHDACLCLPEEAN